MSRINYSLEEQLTGEHWIDGRDIYQKTIFIGALPNTTTLPVPHGIEKFSMAVEIIGSAVTGTTYMPIPYPFTSLNNTISVNMDATNINIITGSDRSSTSSYITVKYVKGA